MSTINQNISFKDKDFLENIEYLLMIEDVYKGSRKIQNNPKYLKQGETESDDKYNERLKFSHFVNYLKPAINLTANILFKKGTSVDYSSKYDRIFKNVDGEGNSIQKFSHQVAKNALKDGYTAVWVDFPKVSEESNLSLFDVELNNIRPYLKNIKRKDILSKKISTVNGMSVLSQVVFKQTIEIPKDEFSTEEEDVYIVLRENQGFIFSETSESKKSRDKYEFNLLDSWENTLGYIPFFPCYSNKEGFFKADLPFYDLAHLNLTLYNLESDHQNIIHLTNVPTLQIFTGESESPLKSQKKGKEENITVGVNKAFKFKDKNTQGIEWVSPSGNCIKDGKENIDSVKKQLESMSLSIFSKESYNTATEANIANSKNNLFLVELANSLETVIEMSVISMEDFSQENYNFTMTLSKDFDFATLDATTIEKLSNMQEKGQISLDTLWKKLEDDEVLKIEDYDAEKEKIKSETVEIL